MDSVITEKDIADAQRLTLLFANLSEDDKSKVVVYASALRDKEIADQKTVSK